MRILSVDPGTMHSGWCLFENRKVLRCGNEVPNHEILRLIGEIVADELAVEMIESYGKPVGRETFETVLWIGRFVQAWRDPNTVRLVYRRDVKSFLCGSANSKDPNVRQALLDLLGPVGNKKEPGPLHGVSGHAWAALAVAATVARCAPVRGAIGGMSEESVAAAT